MTLTCTTCGSKDWIAAAPGTEAEATRFPGQEVLELRRPDALPTRAWCLGCWRKSWVPVRRVEQPA